MVGLTAKRAAAIAFIAVFVISIAGAFIYSASYPARTSKGGARASGKGGVSRLQPVNLSELLSNISNSCSGTRTDLASYLMDVMRVYNSSYLTIYGIPYTYSAVKLGQGVMSLGSYEIKVNVSGAPSGYLVNYTFTLYLNGRRVNATSLALDYPLVRDLCSYAASSGVDNVTIIVLTHYGSGYLIAVEPWETH